MRLLHFREFVLIDLGAIGFRRFCILLFAFLCSSVVLYFNFSPDVARREHVSVFLVGKSSDDSLIDRPEHLVEYARLKLLPVIGRDVMGGEWGNVQVVFTNKPGSRFIHIITRVNEIQDDKLERVHRNLLEALLKHQKQRFLLIRRNLVNVIELQQERLSLYGVSMSGQQEADIKANIYYATTQLESMEPSEIVEHFSSESIDKLGARPVRVLFSLLLAFLFVFLMVFLYALLSARIDTVSVGNVR